MQNQHFWRIVHIIPSGFIKEIAFRTISKYTLSTEDMPIKRKYYFTHFLKPCNFCYDVCPKLFFNSVVNRNVNKTKVSFSIGINVKLITSWHINKLNKVCRLWHSNIPIFLSLLQPKLQKFNTKYGNFWAKSIVF